MNLKAFVIGRILIGLVGIAALFFCAFAVQSLFGQQADTVMAAILVSVGIIVLYMVFARVLLRQKGGIRVFVLATICALCFYAFAVRTLVAHAQDPAPTAEPTLEATVEPNPPDANPTPVIPPTVETPSDILGVVLAALFAGSVAVAGSPLVTAMVSLEKVVVPATVPAETLKNVTGVAVWLIYSLAVHFGFGAQFTSITSYITPILVSVIPLVGVLIGSSKLHQLAVEHSVPLLSLQRTPSPPAA